MQIVMVVVNVVLRSVLASLPAILEVINLDGFPEF